MRKSQEGSVLIETVCACLILVILVAGCLEIFSFVTDSLRINKIARESARAGSLLSMQEKSPSRSACKEKAEDTGNNLVRSDRYFNNSTVQIKCQANKGAMHCQVDYDYRYLKYFGQSKGGGTIHAEATYPYFH